jgi:thiol-disulfide isomerase/thioredoxin
MKKIMLVGLLIILGIGIYAYQSGIKNAAMQEAQRMHTETMKQTEMAKKDVMEKGVVMLQEAEDAMKDAVIEKLSPPPPVDMNPEKMGKYLATEGIPVKGMKNILFFHASWCPTCKNADADLRAHIGTIPMGMVIHRVDYDTAIALRKKYSVTYQHTFVQVDENGKLLKKWSGGQLAEIVKNVM